MTDPGPFGVLDELVGSLEDLSIRYVVGGSLASSTFGTPRSTHDIDILIGLDPSRLERLVSALGDGWYVPVEAARRALQSHGSFNVLHEATGLKVDLFIAGDRQLDVVQLETGVELQLHEGGRRVRVTAPAVIVVRKLAWYRTGGGVSERQWRDVLGILAQQGPEVVDAAARLADDAGLRDLLDRALQESAGSGD